MNASPSDRAAAGRRRFLLVVAVFVAPLAVALGWYALAPHSAPRGDTHGTLIEPARPLEPFETATADGEGFGLDAMRGHWTLVHPVGRDCNERCRQRLHATRQIHDALGEDRIRVRRLALAARGRDTRGLAAILPEHPRLRVARQRAEGALARQFPSAPAGTVYLVDPLGNLMMRFAPETEAGEILDDLERLLKVSRIG